MHASRQAVRCAGIDIGVHRSDRTARVGKLTYQGSAELRWALYEAAQSACRPSSPDHDHYQALKARELSHTRASLTIARKLARRSYHVLRELGAGRAGAPSADTTIFPSSPPITDDNLPASCRSPAGSHAINGRSSIDRAAGGRFHRTTNQPSRHRPDIQRSRTQISQGVHGEQPPPHHREVDSTPSFR